MLLYLATSESQPHTISNNLNHFKCFNSQPILFKLWILHLMTNPNKVYDTRPNLNHLKSQIISTTSNAYISDNSQPIIPHQISSKPTTSNLKISTISNAYISINYKPILVKLWSKPFHEQH